MNYGISILFRAIPLLMALFCFGYGAFVLDMGTDVNRFVAGPVVFSLGMICMHCLLLQLPSSGNSSTHTVLRQNTYCLFSAIWLQ